jgi:hypothetical protein
MVCADKQLRTTCVTTTCQLVMVSLVATSLSLYLPDVDGTYECRLPALLLFRVVEALKAFSGGWCGSDASLQSERLR